MKKVFVILALVVFTCATISCRETTEDKIETAADAAGEDVKAELEKAGDAIEKTVEETEETLKNTTQEIEKEIEGTDDLKENDGH